MKNRSDRGDTMLMFKIFRDSVDKKTNARSCEVLSEREYNKDNILLSVDLKEFGSTDIISLCVVSHSFHSTCRTFFVLKRLIFSVQCQRYLEQKKAKENLYRTKSLTMEISAISRSCRLLTRIFQQVLAENSVVVFH
jgi:hypothetical protein